MKRSNEQWLTDLQSNGEGHDLALADLRQILVSGLQKGLMSRINTNAPEFDTLAEDFVQEAILKILDKLHTFAGRSKFTTWAHKVAVSVALTELRRKRWQDSSLDGIMGIGDGDYTPSLVADPTPQPEKRAAQQEMMGHVERLIRQALTEKQRAAMVASVFEGKPAVEVARLLQMKPNAVYKLIHDARLKLKKALADEGLTPADVLAVFDS